MHVDGRRRLGPADLHAANPPRRRHGLCRTDCVGRGRRGRPARSDLGHVAVLPALVNAHTHIELSHLHGRVPFGPTFVHWVRSQLALRRGTPEIPARWLPSRAARWRAPWRPAPASSATSPIRARRPISSSKRVYRPWCSTSCSASVARTPTTAWRPQLPVHRLAGRGRPGEPGAARALLGVAGALSRHPAVARLGARRADHGASGGVAGGSRVHPRRHGPVARDARGLRRLGSVVGTGRLLAGRVRGVTRHPRRTGAGGARCAVLARRHPAPGGVRRDSRPLSAEQSRRRRGGGAGDGVLRVRHPGGDWNRQPRQRSRPEPVPGARRRAGAGASRGRTHHPRQRHPRGRRGVGLSADGASCGRRRGGRDRRAAANGVGGSDGRRRCGRIPGVRSHARPRALDLAGPAHAQTA